MTDLEIHRDILGREINVGDVVAFNPPRRTGIVLGKIIKFTPISFWIPGGSPTQGVRVQFKPNHWSTELADTALSSADVVKIDGPEATLFILKNGGLSK